MGVFSTMVFASVFAMGAAAPVHGGTLINDADHIEALNRENAANTSWKAGANPFFHGMTFDDAKQLLGTRLETLTANLTGALHDVAGAGDIPAEFDARTKWPGLIHPIRDQQRCGSCWAFSATEVLSDRVAIAAGRASPVLSPEDMVSCDTGDMGCSGGQLAAAWKYLQSTGVVSENCLPYTAGDGQAPQCPNKCMDQESWSASKVKAAKAYAIRGVANMQQEIMTNGPIQVAFMVYKSFMSYTTGVYQKHWYEFLPEGGHAVKIVGWGTEAGVDYWLVANSWNTNWGLEGFFKIKRGVDNCGIETRGPPYAGMPAAASLIV